MNMARYDYAMNQPATKPIAFVAGASSGVGLALSRMLPALGYRVLGLGQRPLAKIADCPFDENSYCSCDLGETSTALLEIDAFLEKNDVTRIDLFIYCAGIGYYGTFETQPTETIERIINVNVRTPILLTRALGGKFQKSRLVYIASVAAFSPAPLYAVYAASKAFLASFSNNLAIEERRENQVQCVHLGPVRTDFHERSGVPIGKFPVTRWDSADQAAEKIMSGIISGKRDIVFGAGPRLLQWIGRRFPEALPIAKGLRT